MTKQTRADRIFIVNKIIEEISNRGRKFFRDNTDIAFIFYYNGRLYMQCEYMKQHIYLHTKYGYLPKNFAHGGTLWGLVWK